MVESQLTPSPQCNCVVTEDEKGGVMHHVMDVVDPTDVTFNVLCYTNLATRAIADIHSRGRLPIVVGGTHYYLENLLRQDTLVASSATSKSPPTHLAEESCITKRESSSTSTISIPSGDDDEDDEDYEVEHSEAVDGCYERLMEVDPDMAARLHPRNHRKILRSLQVPQFPSGSALVVVCVREMKRDERCN